LSFAAEINRQNPGCLIFLLDRSGSMSDPLGGSNKSKAVQVADAMNRLISNIVVQCSKNDGVRDYFYVSVLGYGGHFGPAFSGQLSGMAQVPISMVDQHPLRIEERTKKVDDGAGGIVEQKVRFQVWIDPVSEGGTPMCQALDAAHAICAQWISERPHGFPPIVINLTDGEATDGDPMIGAQRLTALAGTDGNVLLFNLHLSQVAAAPIVFPANESGLPDSFARQLFQMSSVLPDSMVAAARSLELPSQGGSRGFIFNADMPSLVQFLDIGTRPSNMLALR
jgi:hypothetical protein